MWPPTGRGARRRRADGRARPRRRDATGLARTAQSSSRSCSAAMSSRHADHRKEDHQRWLGKGEEAAARLLGRRSGVALCRVQHLAAMMAQRTGPTRSTRPEWREFAEFRDVAVHDRDRRLPDGYDARTPPRPSAALCRFERHMPCFFRMASMSVKSSAVTGPAAASPRGGSPGGRPAPRRARAPRPPGPPPRAGGRGRALRSLRVPPRAPLHRARGR